MFRRGRKEKGRNEIQRSEEKNNFMGEEEVAKNENGLR